MSDVPLKEELVISLPSEARPGGQIFRELPSFYVYYKANIYSVTPQATLERS